ncbi:MULTISPECIES: glycerophosphodiester phosphodiesterase [Cohnella]|uniref:glycerophosphodiester phosphodiesterase n=1 Tax=Cohnella TaxID=329857 RepID=UPI0009BC0278|nr:MULTISPECIES: glycerophosphodiester phosphodiesterase family protein [Cohnella]MBN2983175.1 glycerophosphodiester phosphodiesterase [Cohnella algarum]
MEVSQQSYLHPCVAHRGWSGGAPENTLAAFRLAMSEPSVQWIELDVHLSKDEVPVVIHDATLNRTTNAKGKVRDKTAQELSAVDAGRWFHPIYEGEPVPALEQVLKLAAGRCRLNIELKEGGLDKDLLAKNVTELLRSYRIEQEAVITSFDPELIVAARRHLPEVCTGLIVDKRSPRLVERLRALGADVLSIDYRRLNAALLRDAEEAGIRIMAWTVNDRRELAKLAAMPQAFQICTNYPDRWLQAVRQGADSRR